jgi:hypothetical protein
VPLAKPDPQVKEYTASKMNEGRLNLGGRPDSDSLGRKRTRGTGDWTNQGAERRAEKSKTESSYARAEDRNQKWEDLNTFSARA